MSCQERLLHKAPSTHRAPRPGSGPCAGQLIPAALFKYGSNAQYVSGEELLIRRHAFRDYRMAAERHQWQYELKLDGFRAIGRKSARSAQLRSRNQKDFARRFPHVARMHLWKFLPIP
jgi:hypothetical protein